MTVQINFCRMTHHQPLQAACPFIQARQAYKLVLDFLPVRVGINKEAVILVDRRHQVAIATGLDPIPVSGRNCQTPLCVQSDFGGPTQHGLLSGSGDSIQEMMAAFTLSSHFFPLFAILFGPSVTVNRNSN